MLKGLQGVCPLQILRTQFLTGSTAHVLIVRFVSKVLILKVESHLDVHICSFVPNLPWEFHAKSLYRCNGFIYKTLKRYHVLFVLIMLLGVD